MKRLKGSATIEMTYIMPVIFLVFMAIVYAAFYFHDKNILQGTAYETAVVMSQKMRMQGEADGDSIFRERLGSKLIFFDAAAITVDSGEQEITVSVTARRGAMGIFVEQRAGVITAEKQIRDQRRAENIVQE